MKKSYRIVAVLLVCVMMTCLLTACGSKPKTIDGTQTAVTINDDAVNVGELMVYARAEQATYNDYYENLMTQLAGYNIQVPKFEDAVADGASDLEANTENETGVPTVHSGMKIETTGESIIDSAVVYLSDLRIAGQHADDYGVSLNDDDLILINDYAAQVYDNSDTEGLSSSGITLDDVKNYFTDYFLYLRLYDAYRNTSDIAVSDEDSDVMTLTVAVFESDSDDAKDDVKTEADKFLKDCMAESDTGSLDFATMVGSTEYGTYSSANVPVNDPNEDDYIFPVEDIKAIAAMNEGDIYDKVLESEGSYYIMRLDKRHNAEASADYADSLLSTAVDQAFRQQIYDWRQESDVVFNVDLLNTLGITDDVVFTGISEETTEESSETEPIEEDNTDTTDTEVTE